MKAMQLVATTSVQTDLFGGSFVERKKVRAVDAPVRLQKTIPVITGGLFALKDTISPERFSAAFHSGASAYFDALGLTMAGKDVGVVLYSVVGWLPWLITKRRSSSSTLTLTLTLDV